MHDGRRALAASAKKAPRLSTHQQQRNLERAKKHQAKVAAAAAAAAPTACVEPKIEQSCPQLQMLGHLLRRKVHAMRRHAVWTRWMRIQIAEDRLRHLAARAYSVARLQALNESSHSDEHSEPPSTPPKSSDPWKDALDASFTNARHSPSPKKKKRGKKSR